MTVVRWVLTGLAAVVLLLAVAAGAGVVWLNGESGRAWLAATVEGAVSGPDMTLRLEGLGGSLFALSVGRITLADRQGVWLTLDGGRLVLDPAALLARRVQVEALEARRIAVERTPATAPAQQTVPAEPAAAAGFLPSLPVSVTVERLAVDEIALGPALMGGEVVRLQLAASGRLAAGAAEAALRLEARRIDAQPGRVSLDLAFVPRTQTLRLELHGEEPAGGAIVRAAALPGLPPLRLEATGQGPLSDWHGTLTVVAGDMARLETAVGVTGVAGGHAVTLSAGADARRLVEALAGPQAAALAGDRPALTAEVLVAPDGGIATVQPLTLTAAAGTLALSGSVAAGGTGLDLGYTLTVAEDSPLHALAPVRWSAARAEGRVSGTLPTLTVTAAAVVRDLLSDDPALAPLAGPEARLDAAARIDTAGGAVTVSALTLASPAAAVTVTGQAAGWGRTAEARIGVNAADLSRFAGLAGQPLAGPATLDGRVSMDADGSVRVEGVTVDTPYARVADGRAVLAAGRLDAGGRLLLDDLARLEPWAATPLAGSAALDVSAHGPLSALEVEARATTRDLDVQGRALGTVTLSATAAGLPLAPRGRVQVGGRLEGQALGLAGSYALEGRSLRLSDLSLTAGTNTVTGGLTLDLGSAMASGRLDGAFPALKDLSALAGVGLEGGATLAVTLDGRGGRQAVAVTASAQGLAVAGESGALLSARRLSLEAEVADALGTATGKARLSLNDGAAGGQPVSAVIATVDGSLAKAAFQVAVTGAGEGAPALQTAGTAGREGETTRIRLDTLTARVAGQSLALNRPATLDLGPRRYAVSGLSVTGSGARLTADVGLSDGQMQGTVSVAQVPLALAALVDPGLALDGTVGLDIALGGTARAPRADFKLRLSGVAAAGMAQAGLPGIDAAIDGAWRDRRLTADGSLSGRGDSGRLTVRLAVPLVLDPDTLALSVPAKGPLSAAARGTFQLTRFNDLLAASGDRMRGTLAVDVTAGGTVDAPQLGGSVTIAGGRYENRASGAVVSDIAARLVGDGRVFTLQSFSGRAAGGGTITASGTVRPAPQEPRQLDLRVKADNARLLAIDLVTGQVDADLSLTGTFARALLAGTVRVDRAEVTIPNRLPSDVVDLKVTEVGRGRNTAIPAAAKPAPSKPAPAKPTPTKASKPVKSAPAKGKAPPPAPPPAVGPVVALDVRVEVPGQVFVRGRGLDAELGGELHAGGTAAAPAVTGRLSILRGQLDLLGKIFAFKRGNLDFDGAQPIDPRVDVMAEGTANQTTAQVEIAGTARRPSVALTSPQGLPQDEVLARVLFGKPVGQLGAAEALQLAQSAAQLAGFGGGSGLLDTVRRSLGIDRLEFSQGQDGQPGGVEAGRYLGDGVYVGVEQGLGADQSRAKVEVDITDSVKAEAKVGGSAGTSLGLKFEWDY